jgi:hypothetical protein
MLITHPGVKDELKSTLEKFPVTIKIHENKFNIFRMSGPESIQRLNKLLKQFHY